MGHLYHGYVSHNQRVDHFQTHVEDDSIVNVCFQSAYRFSKNCSESYVRWMALLSAEYDEMRCFCHWSGTKLDLVQRALQIIWLWINTYTYHF